MDKKSKLYVSEIFTSVQGEGINAGKMAIFLRLAGCNLRCKFCDTPTSLDMKDGREVGISELTKELLTYANKDVRHLVITGGEPGMQRVMLRELFADLYFRNKFLSCIDSIDVETNGMGNLDWGFLSVMGIKLNVSWSPKFPLAAENYSGLAETVSIKLVVEDVEKVETQVREIVERCAFARRDKFFLQPVDASSAIAKALVERNCFGLRLCMQIHKMIGVA